MKISFVILTYRRGAILQRCIDSILAQKNLPLPAEIIVVDNGGDAVVAPSSNRDIEIRVELPLSNLWAAGGRNLGMRLAKGEYIVVIDDDATWVGEDAVMGLIDHLEQNPRCGAVAVKSQSPNGDIILTELPHPNKDYLLNQQSAVEVPYFYTMGMALRADVLRKIGYYPERFEIYAEEIDLSLRLIDAEYVIIYEPSVAVYHARASQGRLIRGAEYWLKNALNKSRVAWRLLPQPYPITTMAIWSGAVLIKTRSFRSVISLWSLLWHERELLRQERSPIKASTVRYLKKIGARLMY